VQALNRLAGVLTYDRRGYGRSAALPPEPVTAKAATADLQQLLESLHISQPVVLVGHSLGELYAQYFTPNDPRQVVAVVLLDAASPSIRWLILASKPELNSHLARLTIGKTAEGIRRSCKPANHRRSRPYPCWC
jgi:pimeloyl-ACP methyl ester carboxylesterase